MRPRFHIAAGFRVARATDVPGCALMTGPVGSARLLMAHTSAATGAALHFATTASPLRGSQGNTCNQARSRSGY